MLARGPVTVLALADRHAAFPNQAAPGALATGRSSRRYVRVVRRAVLRHAVRKSNKFSPGLRTPCPQCYAQTDTPTECTPQSEDYLECLHHAKAVRLPFCLVFFAPVPADEPVSSSSRTPSSSSSVPTLPVHPTRAHPGPAQRRRRGRVQAPPRTPAGHHRRTRRRTRRPAAKAGPRARGREIAQPTCSHVDTHTTMKRCFYHSSRA